MVAQKSHDSAKKSSTFARKVTFPCAVKCSQKSCQRFARALPGPCQVSQVSQVYPLICLQILLIDISVALSKP